MRQSEEKEIERQSEGGGKDQGEGSTRAQGLKSIELRHKRGRRQMDP